MKYRCAHCGKVNDKAAGHVNRARVAGLNLYCNRKCSGLGRRDGKTKAQRVEEKRLYDAEYRKNNREMLKAKKAKWHKQTYDPVAAAAHRKTRMPYHVEYCRRPEYKRWKKDYDRKHRSKKWYGPFAEAFMMMQDLKTEIKTRSSKYEIDYQNGKLCKAQIRRRASAQGPQRGRNSRRGGAGYSAAHG